MITLALGYLPPGERDLDWFLCLVQTLKGCVSVVVQEELNKSNPAHLGILRVSITGGHACLLPATFVSTAFSLPSHFYPMMYAYIYDFESCQRFKVHPC